MQLLWIWLIILFWLYEVLILQFQLVNWLLKLSSRCWLVFCEDCRCGLSMFCCQLIFIGWFGLRMKLLGLGVMLLLGQKVVLGLICRLVRVFGLIWVVLLLCDQKYFRLMLCLLVSLLVVWLNIEVFLVFGIRLRQCYRFCWQMLLCGIRLVFL